MWAHNFLRTKYFHEVSPASLHAYSLKSRYGIVSQLCHWEPLFLSFQFPQAFFMRTSDPAITYLLHFLHGFAASGSLCPSMPPRPQGPSRSRRMRGAVREHAILAIS